MFTARQEEMAKVAALGSRKEEEEEAIFIRDSITNDDPPNAYQAQHRAQTTGAMNA